MYQKPQYLNYLKMKAQLIKIKINSKVHHRTGHKGPDREQMYGSTLEITI